MVNRDRAQLVLVGAIAIGIVLIALTTVLNSAVFTENVAGGRSVEVTGDVTEFDREAIRNVRSIAIRIGHAETYHNGERAELSNRTGSNVGNYSDVMAESYADTGSVYVNVTYENTTTFGGRVVRDADGNLTRHNGMSPWTPVTGPAEIGWFVVNFDVENVSQSDPVHFNFTDVDGTTYNVSFRRTAGNDLGVRSTIDGGNVSVVTCQAEDGRVLLDVLEGSSYSGDCTFNATEYLDPTYAELRIENGEGGWAKYDLVVNDTGTVTGIPSCASPKRPCRGIAPWKIEVTTHYRTASIAYEKTHNVSVYGG